jgi:protein phosphatase
MRKRDSVRELDTCIQLSDGTVGRLRAAAITATGSKHFGQKKKNQDAFAILRGLRSSYKGKPTEFVLAMAADGMGGRPAGRFACLLTIDEITDQTSLWKGHPPQSWEDAISWVAKNAIPAVRQAFARAIRKKPARKKMSTTLTSALFLRFGLLIWHIGDSRAYRYRAGEGLNRLTRDHNAAEDPDVSDREKDRIRSDGIRLNDVISRFICADELHRPAFWQSPIRRGDSFVLITDGGYVPLTDKVLEEILSTPRATPRTKAYRIVRAAHLADPFMSDDATVIVITVA